MSIIKTFLIDIHHNDGKIDTRLPFKAKSLSEAMALAQIAYPDVYIGTIVHKSGAREFSRGLCWGRSSWMGRFLHHHKGKKRRGMKNYPLPKGRWRRPLRPLIVTWTENYIPAVKPFYDSWLTYLREPSANQGSYKQ